MRRIKKHKKRIRLLPFILTVTVIIGFFILLDMRVRPIIEETSIYQSKVYGNRIIDNAVLTELAKADKEYSDLVKLDKLPDGSISAVESNMAELSRLKSRINQTLNEDMLDLEKYGINIHVGTLSGIPMAYGKGFHIPVTLSPRGYAETHFISEFSDTGINQTRHSIVMTVSVKITAILPGYTTNTEINTEYIVAETLIVGKIPQSYTHIVI